VHPQTKQYLETVACFASCICIGLPVWEYFWFKYCFLWLSGSKDPTYHCHYCQWGNLSLLHYCQWNVKWRDRISLYLL